MCRGDRASHCCDPAARWTVTKVPPDVATMPPDVDGTCQPTMPSVVPTVPPTLGRQNRFLVLTRIDSSDIGIDFVGTRADSGDTRIDSDDTRIDSAATSKRRQGATRGLSPHCVEEAGMILTYPTPSTQWGPAQTGGLS